MGDPVMTALVVRAQNRDEVAIAALFDLAKNKLFKFCFNLCGNRHLAEDLCQEAFVKAFKNVHTLKDPEVFQGWLYRIARNHFFDEVRRPSNSEEATPDLELVCDGGHTSELQDENLQVRQALFRLEPKEREVLILVDMEEYSYQEAADILGLSENAVRSRVHRARQAFLDVFKTP